MPVPGSGTGGRADLPAEHGFRFFPGFYRHLPDTMARIPHGGGSAADHLVPATRILLAQAGGRDELVAAARAPSSLDDLAVLVRFAWEFGTGAGIPPPELALFVERLLTLLTSCDERRLEQWERSSWWDYIGAPAAQRGVPEVPRRRADAHAGGRAGARDLGAHRRADPVPAAVRPHPRRRARGPRARRADERGVDRPLGGSPAHARRGLPRRLRGGRDRVRRAPHQGSDRAGRRGGPSASSRTITSRRCRSSACGCCCLPPCAPPSRGSPRCRGWSCAG